MITKHKNNKLITNNTLREPDDIPIHKKCIIYHLGESDIVIALEHACFKY